MKINYWWLIVFLIVGGLSGWGLIGVLAAFITYTVISSLYDKIFRGNKYGSTTAT